MTTLTLIGGPMDHMTTSSTYLLTTTSGTTTTTAGTTTSKITPKRQRQESTSSDNSFRATPAPKRSRLNGGAPPAVARRNERERNRVRQVNQGFQTLRQHVPNGVKSKKMSKVETLRSAVQYIKQLQQLLGGGGEMDDEENYEEEEEEENSVPSFDEHLRHLRPQHFPSTPGEYGDVGARSAGGATVGFGGLTPASSPTPSLGSDASSPYDSLSPEDEELLDFTTWLS